MLIVDNRLDINHQAHQIYTYNVSKGWWDNGQDCPYQKIVLISSEISELVEGIRKGLMDDHLPERPMGEVELADAMIRTLDLAGHMGWVYTNNSLEYGLMRKRLFTENWSEGRRIELLSRTISKLADAVEYGNKEEQDATYSAVINGYYILAEFFAYNLEDALLEKQIYNTVRKDHTKEIRQSIGGKRW